jgi:hypothetical protein
MASSGQLFDRRSGARVYEQCKYPTVVGKTKEALMPFPAFQHTALRLE